MIKSANTQTYYSYLNSSSTFTINFNSIHVDDLCTVSNIGNACKLPYSCFCWKELLLSSLIGMGALVKRISFSYLCLSKWEKMVNILVKIEQTLTSSDQSFPFFWWVLLFWQKMAHVLLLSHFLSLICPLILPPLHHPPLILPLSLSLFFVSITGIKGIVLFSTFSFYVVAQSDH